jgi:acetylornithine deacetylase/succinyl-diaminopimelate desuccinylase-like protein
MGPQPRASVPAVEAWIERTADERLEEYVEFLRIPTVGTLQEHGADMVRGAGWLADRLRSAGLEHVEVSPTPGHPIVYADWLHAADAPTVLVYGHYDVQPTDPLDEWVRPPFEPRVEGGRVYARGAADDKGQVHLHVWAARAWLEAAGRLPINVRYVFEGEEESGSTNFEAWVLANRERLEADVAVVSDTGFYEGNVPAITVGLRGLMYLQIDVLGSSRDLHSGTYGGVVQNPANALTRILAALRHADGRIAVPGFYDQVRELGPDERAQFARLPFDEQAFAAEIGVAALFGEPGFAPAERRGARPTLDVNGIWGGFQGEGSKTIIPARAHAKVSCRLVPDMDPTRTFEVVRDAIHAVHVPGVRVDVRLLNDGWWSLAPLDHPATRSAMRCLEEVFGAKPYVIREGGSIPAAATFASALGLPVVLLGFTNPDDQAHAPNESMVLANYEGGLRTIARYWEALAQRDA